MGNGDRKHPCPDCRQCQWCTDDRCRLCLKMGSDCSRKLSMAEQIALYEELNRTAAGPPGNQPRCPRRPRSEPQR